MVFPHPLWHQALTRKVCTHTRLCVLHACVIPPPVCLCLDWSCGEFYRLFFFFFLPQSEFPTGQTPGKKKDKIRDVAELVLFFMPKVGEEPAEEDKLSTQLEPKIMVFWQGLYFAEERLDAQVLPWMKRARDAFNKKAQGEIADAFDRVVGFLFLDGSFRPDSHKTRLHMQDELVKELMEPPTSHRGSTRQVANL